MMTREGTTEGYMLAYHRMLPQWLPVKQRMHERIRRKLYPAAIKKLLINIWEEVNSAGDFHVLQTFGEGSGHPKSQALSQNLNVTEGEGNHLDTMLRGWNHPGVIL